jgi:hypothetical protein
MATDSAMQQLKIETFNNVKGGNSFYKAVTHPAVAPAAEKLLRRLNGAGRVAIYDPLGFVAGFAEFYDLSRLALAGIFVQDVAAIGRPMPAASSTTSAISCRRPPRSSASTRCGCPTPC